MSRSVELAAGIIANVAEDVSAATINELRNLAHQLRYREQHGWLSSDPMKIEDGISYENRDLVCASCGARMPHAPWPTNSTNFVHRPRCGKCNSPMTVPSAPANLATAPSD